MTVFNPASVEWVDFPGELPRRKRFPAGTVVILL
jgi:hypothetical protein